VDRGELNKRVRVTIRQRKFSDVVVHGGGWKGSDEQLFGTRVLVCHEERLSKPKRIVGIV
jgi:hypothetical protein